MANQTLYSLNRGVVDRRGLARADVKRLALAAQQQTNWLPKVLGPMALRQGLKYIGPFQGASLPRLLRFIFSTDDTAVLELTDHNMRVWINDTLLTRPSVATTITNGDFTSNLTGWTDNDDAGGASTWVSGQMQLLGSGTARAIRDQLVTNASPGIEHGIRIVINRGPVMLRIGTTLGADDILSETKLETGQHSLSITPAGNFYIRFFATQARIALVESCNIEAAGAVLVPTPWATSDFDNIRYDQSADVLFVACKGIRQHRIERRGDRPNARGWSVVYYFTPDGPFLVQNTSATTLAPSAITGNITVTSSVPLFKLKHVGALFSLTSVGQQTTVAASAANTFSASIRVTGLSAQRGFGIVVTGTFVGTVVLQQSFDNAVWSDVTGKSWTAPVSTSYNDGLDNQIVFYRIGIAGDYTSGTATCQLSFTAGNIRGVVRVTGYTNATTVSAEVLSDLGGTAASAVWEEGRWSDVQGWPTSVGIHEGRLWWAGQNGIQGSISDAYDSFDETFQGDAAPIDRTVGSGPVDTINWILSLKGLLLGAQGAEYSVRSSSLDEPLTPTNFNLKASSTQGSGVAGAVKVDQSGYFVDRTSCKVFEMAFDVRSYDYTAVDMMALAPEIARVGILRIDVQRKPDTRLHAVLKDGTAIICVLNRQEEVAAWIPFVTDGFVEDVVVLPALAGDLDDQVYYAVRRTINGSDVHYLEKWSQEIDCRGGQLSMLADCCVSFTGAPATVFAVPHLTGKNVVVWADGQDVGTNDSTTTWTQTYTATAGVVTLNQPASNVVIGLGYTATFQSAKLGLQTPAGSGIGHMKRGHHISLLLADTHRRGVRFGPELDVLDDMPVLDEDGPALPEVIQDYDASPIEFPGQWTTDLRICIVAQAPRPATVMAISLDEAQH